MKTIIWTGYQINKFHQVKLEEDLIFNEILLSKSLQANRFLFNGELASNKVFKAFLIYFVVFQLFTNNLQIFSFYLQILLLEDEQFISFSLANAISIPFWLCHFLSHLLISCSKNCSSFVLFSSELILVALQIFCNFMQQAARLS